jgi:glycosyltransferase involved in cell wall biosynthesis
MLPFKKAEMRRYGFSWMFVKLLLLRFSQSASFRNAEGVIFLNEHARSVVMGQKKNFKGQWRIIPHGIDQRFHLKPRAQKPLNAYSKVKPFRLLYVSKVHPYKHQWHVVEAVTRLKREGIPIELDLVGSAYRSALRRLSKVVKRVDRDYDFIHYKGQVPYDNLVQYYHRADGFVFASSCENMPNIILEAMAAGLPIACSNREPMPEVLGDGGIYFNPESAEEIAEALERLIMDSALRELCAQFAYERAKQYSWRRCSRNTLDFLVQVANSG